MYFYFRLDNGIDGEALKELVNDFYEFSSLVTAPLARLKIKKAVKGFLSTQEVGYFWCYNF